MKAFPCVIAALVLISVSVGAAQVKSVESALCGQLDGKTATDIQHLTVFCSKGIVKGTITSAAAMDSLLWLKVSRSFADEMRRDRLSAEQVVKNWMAAWRIVSGRRSVSITVEWQQVEVAKGDTTMTGADRVTIR